MSNAACFVSFKTSANVLAAGYIANVHVQAGAAAVKQRFGERLKTMQYRYEDAMGRWTGGIVVSDALAQCNAGLMFR